MARVELLVTVDKVVSGDLQPVSGASVLVKKRSTGSPVTIYAAETGGTTVSNPLVTDSNGRVNGWVDEASLILTISGAGITTYNQPYEALKADELVTINGARVIDSTLPGSALTAASVVAAKIANGAVLGKHLGESAMPLGTILAWWQPSKPGGGFVIPSGFALANGQVLGVGAHDFPGGGSVTLPNLIDKALVGADPALAYGATGSSLGMHGVAGANTANLSHTHTIAHTHSIPGHSHQIQDHSHYMGHGHNAWVPDHSHGMHLQKIGVGGTYVTVAVDSAGTYGYGGVTISTDGGNRSYTDGATPSTANQSGGTDTNAASTGSSGSAGSASQDMRQASQGVLFIIKVRNTV